MLFSVLVLNDYPGQFYCQLKINFWAPATNKSFTSWLNIYLEFILIEQFAREHMLRV